MNAAILALSAVSLLPSARAELPLLPQPREVRETGGAFAVRPETRIAIYPDDPDLRFAAKMAAEELGGRLDQRNASILIGLPERSPELAEACRAAGLSVPADEGLPRDQGYALAVTPERVVVAASTPVGAFYGVQTLLQLAQAGGGREIPGVRIRDWPAMRWRGILTDQSRQAVPSVATYKRLIRELSRYKINFVTMHLEHTFEVKKHPAISAGTGALTATDVREICDYARQYHTLFFPSFEAFGHQWHIFKHPEYADLAESDWKYSFAPTVEGTYQLLADLFDEMCAAFTGTDFFNAGSDEVGDLGAGKSRDLAAKIGKPALYARHMNRVHDLLKQRGKRMMMWGDMLLQHPEAIDLIPKDTVIMDWHYGAEHDYPSIAQFQDHGFEVIVCPALSSWVRLFPDYELACENMEWLIRRGRERNVLGSMTCNWGDDGNENLISYSDYGWLFAAECSWGAQERVDRDRFHRAFSRQLFGVDAAAPAKAVHLLTQANFAFSRDSTLNFRFFHGDPFTGPFRTSWPREKQWRALRECVEEARREIAACKARRNPDDLAAMDFAARRMLFVADKAELMEAARAGYQAAYQSANQAEALRQVREVAQRLTQLRASLQTLKDEFVRRWDAENHHEGIEYNLARFDAQLKSFDTHLARLEEVAAKGALPDPAVLDLDDRRFRRELRPQLADLPKSAAAWASPEAPVRAPVEIAAGKHDRVNAPILVDVPPRLLQAAPPLKPEECRPVLVLGGREVPSQLVPTAGEHALRVACIAPGKLAAGAKLSGELYLRPGPAAAPAAGIATVSVTPAEANLLVRAGPYEALVGAEGAHLFTWKLAALNGEDITQPGESGWAGFFDDPRYRTTPFRLSATAAGPVLAIVHAEEEGGYWKDLYFWAGQPFAEAVYSDGTGMSWCFDGPAVFAADMPKPGTAHFSSGFSGPVPASTESRQVPEGGASAWWCCKTRADGLTLGLTTPLEPTNMRVGPGGGWGGVGIEASNAAQYFVVYCDVDARGPAAVAELYETLARDDPIRVIFGPAEVRP